MNLCCGDIKECDTDQVLLLLVSKNVSRLVPLLLGLEGSSRDHLTNGSVDTFGLLLSFSLLLCLLRFKLSWCLSLLDDGYFHA